MIPLIVVAVIVILAVFFFTGKPTGASQKKNDDAKAASPERRGKDALADILKDSVRKLGEILSPAQELSYEEAMKYCIAHKNDKPEIVKGAILKENTDGGFWIVQLFLDRENRPVEKDGHLLGYRRKVSRLDTELLDLFKNEDLIIVE